MCFDLHFSPASIILFSIAVLFLIFIFSVYCPRVASIKKIRKQCDEEPLPDSAPGVSVIVYAQDLPGTLTRNLPMLLQQEYPGNYDVIVVNDGSSAEINMVVGAMKRTHKNIYLTFTPEGGHNISRKKLAITLGVKAAKQEYVLICDASSRIESAHWLAAMMRHFQNRETEVVLGYGKPDINSSCSPMVFDAAEDAAIWIRSAAKGSPYRGCGYNLAYKRELFFSHNGFSQSINLRDGDDDIFIYDIANKHNTTVELSEQSIVTHDSNMPKREMRDFRTSHAFTGARLPKAPRRIMAMGEWLMWGVVAVSLTAAFLMGINNTAGWSITIVLVLAMLAIVGASWQSATDALMLRCSWWISGILAMTRPYRNIAVSLRSRASSFTRYTWQ